MTEVKLGKIEKIKLGVGGYQDAMFGVSFTFSMGGTSVGDFKGSWINYPESANYSRDSFDKSHNETYMFIKQLMKKAKVANFNDLVGIPVEITLTDFRLVSWRVLEEVL